MRYITYCIKSQKLTSCLSQVTECYLILDVKTNEPQNETIECPVCLGPAVFPVRIPCGHVFCFLCVKGAARQANKCPMCRQQIPVDFDKNPNILARQEVENILDDGYQWFYEGKNGM